MKSKLIIIVALLFLGKIGICQTSTGGNGEYVDGVFTPATIITGSTSTLEVTVANGTVSAAAGTVQIFVNFPNSGSYIDVTPASGPTASPGSDPFTWIQLPDSPGSQSWLGTNDAVLLDFAGGVFTFQIQGVNPSLGDITITTGFWPDEIAEDNPELVVNAPLPVEFTKFIAYSERCDFSQLSWSVVNEVNNKGFEIQRMVGAKGDFKTVGFVQGAGTSSSLRDYEYKDDLFGKYNNENIYYRLKQVDFNGKFDFSDVVSVTPSCKPELSLKMSPNPTKDILNVSLYGFTSQEVDMQLIDPTGKVVKVAKLGSGIVNEVNLKEMPAGAYTIQIAGDGEVITNRVIKID